MSYHTPHRLLLKAVDKLKQHHIYVVPHYREDGMGALIEAQDRVNGVLQPAEVYALDVSDDKLQVRHSQVEWEERDRLLPKAPRVKKPKTPDLTDKFTVLDNPNPVWDQQFSYEEIKDRPPHTVWTVVEGDSGKLYALTGVHFVNRLHFAVTKEEWTEEDESIDYKW